MELKFSDYKNYMGFTVVTPTGNVPSTTNPCKETFASRIRRADYVAGGVVRFLRKDGYIKTPETAKRQQRVLRTFERAMGIKPYAKCEVVTKPGKTITYSWSNRKGFVKEERFFLYTVSEQWIKSIPMAHILALVVRNYVPDTVEVNWKKILDHFAGKKDWSAMPAIREIIANKGEVDPNIRGEGGISTYYYNLKRVRAAQERNQPMPYQDNWAIY